jgi:DNA-directed RNA polymerase specialized sigma24 family protein
MRHIIDPDASWEQLVSSQLPPSRELFDQLFAEGDREKIILATLPLIRRLNKNTKQSIREDVEAFAVMKVVEAVDRLLERPNENAGSYLLTTIRGAIHDARYGCSVEAQQCSPSTDRIYKPRKRKTDAKRDALIRDLERQGCSPRMIESELSLHGFDRSRIVTPEAEWPHEQSRDQDQHFGEKVPMEFGRCDPNNDDWEHLIELHEAGVLTDDDMALLDCLMQGFTQDEAADVFSTSLSTIKTRLKRIQQAIHNHDEVGSKDNH